MKYENLGLADHDIVKVIEHIVHFELIVRVVSEYVAVVAVRQNYQAHGVVHEAVLGHVSGQLADLKIHLTTGEINLKVGAKVESLEEGAESRGVHGGAFAIQLEYRLAVGVHEILVVYDKAFPARLTLHWVDLEILIE